jgi:hypothetical protein
VHSCTIVSRVLTKLLQTCNVRFYSCFLVLCAELGSKFEGTAFFGVGRARGVGGGPFHNLVAVEHTHTSTAQSTIDGPHVFPPTKND